MYEELTLYEHLRLTAMAYDIDEKTFEKRLKTLLAAFRMERYMDCFPVFFQRDAAKSDDHERLFDRARTVHRR